MNQRSSPPPWREGANYPSPVRKVLAFGYYDGPTEGVLQCEDGSVYRFDLLAWDPQTQDVRVFALSPLPLSQWERLTALCGDRESPRWPVWGVKWDEGLKQPVDDILRQAGPARWVVATEDLQGEILRAKAMPSEQVAAITDWGAFLGLAEQLSASGPDLKSDD